MADFQQVKQTQEDDAIEITDLESLDHFKRDLPGWFAHKILDWQRSPRRKPWQYACITGILALLIILVSLNNNFPFLIMNSLRADLSLSNAASQSHTLPSLLPRRTHGLNQQDGLSCLTDAEWSPDSKFIAVLGYQQQCDEKNGMPGILNIYDVSSGKLIRQCQVDEAILNVLNAGLPPPGTTSTDMTTCRAGLLGPSSVNAGSNRILPIYYKRVLWSPAGQQFALEFSTTIQQQIMDGLLLMNTDGRHTQLLLQPQNDTDTLPVEWDLARETSIVGVGVPPATGYSWGSGGKLIPETLLTDRVLPSAHASLAIGNPDGGQFFSIWQPGYAALTNISGMYVWNTSFGAWSPDGRYLMQGIGVTGLMPPTNHPALDARTSATFNQNHMPLITMHDAALMRVATASSVVSWRPDGRVLAAYNYWDSVNLYDCLTGNLITSLQLPPRSNILSGATALLRWSPDGSHLLLSSSQYGPLLIWGPDQIPG
ncbi:MAG TPA: WD40 repeat domain-containing protein [Ktedonobacteraceae bacterium]|nr:WD40 repeat domain-containing protein [Ktedonobacteraceae bacterium]